MKPYQDNLIQIYNKDCRSMDELPDESVQAVCTSPPYWGLRRYADLPDLVWGGDKDCEHRWDIPTSAVLGFNTLFRPEGEISTPLGLPSDIGKYAETVKGGADRQQVKQVGSFCSLCGAWKGSYGLEPTPEMYIQHTIEILREIRRVLRKDGVVFWNIGDSYASGKGTCFNPGGGKGSFSGHGDRKDSGAYPLDRGNITMLRASGLKPKDLCLIPFRVAAAAQEDGWWVRSVIIWSKPNPMPESVTDRPTESHEYILMLTKSGTTQYWTHRDGGGTRERPKADYRWVNRLTSEEVAIEPADWKEKIPCSGCNGTGKETAVLWGDYEVEIGKCPECGGKGKVKLWKRINLWRGHDYYWDADAVREPWKPNEYDIARAIDGGFRYQGKHKNGYDKASSRNDHLNAYATGQPIGDPIKGRNIRSVWEFPTFGYPKAHFAVFPEKLPELCIKAATPEAGCCSKCGAPWERVIDKQVLYRRGKTDREKYPVKPVDGNPGIDVRFDHDNVTERKTVAWQPTCKCNADKVPSVVLDNFCGTGTTLWVAKKLGRRAVGYELSEAYCALSLERNRQMVMELTS